MDVDYAQIKDDFRNAPVAAGKEVMAGGAALALGAAAGTVINGTAGTIVS